MLHRKRTQSNRKYAPIHNGKNPDVSNTSDYQNINFIPLPNEPEKTSGYQKHDARISNPFSFLTERIKLEEIILIGLIFLLFEEGIQDEFLLLVLVYILLTGMT